MGSINIDSGAAQPAASPAAGQVCTVAPVVGVASLVATCIEGGGARRPAHYHGPAATLPEGFSGRLYTCSSGARLEYAMKDGPPVSGVCASGQALFARSGALICQPVPKPSPTRVKVSTGARRQTARATTVARLAYRGAPRPVCTTPPTAARASAAPREAGSELTGSLAFD
jgi:hypothetical protein